MLDFALAALVLGVIVWTSLRIENTIRKIVVFLALGVLTVAHLLAFGGEVGAEVVRDVFATDYPQFIGIPLVTVSIASLRLFSRETPRDAEVGWFLALATPLVANLGTTWAVTPVTLSLIPHLRRAHPDRWVLITITVFVFSANFLAMGTLLADPPQSYWAIRAARDGNPLGFLFPLTRFWPFLVVTWLLYVAILARLGVRFGRPIAGLRFTPTSWLRFAIGLAFAATIGLALSLTSGWTTTIVLGSTLLIALALSRFAFGPDERRDTVHWTAETAATFVAFFSVVALAHAGMADVAVPDEGMIAAVALMTMGADNAAAFAAGFARFIGRPEEVMVWYNLFNAIAYGGLTPLGNGPQITLFLVILVGMKHVRAGRVFDEWMRTAAVLAPYLLIWTVGTYRIVSSGRPPDTIELFEIGIVAFTVAWAWMTFGSTRVPYLDTLRHHRHHPRR